MLQARGGQLKSGDKHLAAQETQMHTCVHQLTEQAVHSKTQPMLSNLLHRLHSTEVLIGLQYKHSLTLALLIFFLETICRHPANVVADRRLRCLATMSAVRLLSWA